jgi:gamma-glutamyltranspeptidase/glutathione hydrolase
VTQELESWRPTVAGSHYAVSTGHSLATAAAMRVLDKGGNAIDAGVTAAMALAILQPDVVSFAGVAPTLVYLRETGQVVSLEGLGYWPAATDVATLRAAGGDAIPDGILLQVVPAAPATHIEALRRFGTISFEEAVTPAYELARDGFYMYPALRNQLEEHAADIDRYAENAAIYRPGGVTPPIGARLRQTNLARTMWRMVEAERAASGDRHRKLRAAHDCFYKGSIAADIAAFHERNGGFMRRDDLANFEVPVTDSISSSYRELQVHSGNTWCQGIVLNEALKILEGIDLGRMRHNEPAYLHVIAQALELAFADREAYVGDPKFVHVPVAELLSDAYAAQQRARIDPARTQPGHSPGRLQGAKPHGADAAVSMARVPAPPDTIYACVVDRFGNAYSGTPSDPMYNTPMVDGLGLAVSSRGMQSRMDVTHPSGVAPGKRPRLTPTPALAFEHGEFRLAWGTPGGDVQCQAMLQVLLNIVQFGMPVQKAVEAPRIGTYGFPSSFPPYAARPGRLCMESRIPTETRAAMQALGYDVECWPEASWLAGSVCAVWRDSATGLLHAGADPRRGAYAMAW